MDQHASASATTVANILGRGADLSSSIPTITGGKHLSSQDDPDRGVKKRSWRTGSPAEEALQTPTSYTTKDTNATSPDTGVDHGDDVSREASSHGTEGSPARQATPAEAGVSAQAHAELLHEVKQLRETLS